MRHLGAKGLRIGIVLTFVWTFVVGVAMAAGPSSVTYLASNAPATGTSYKLTVEEDGLYRLSYEDLAAVGVPVDTVDPRTFKVWEQGEEIAIYVLGEEDGSFDAGDAIFFYGKMARTRYQDPNVYWLTYGGAFGLRMTQRDVTPGTASPPPPFRRLLHLEENHEYRRDVPMEAGADHWYWESYYAFPCPNPNFCFANDTNEYSFTLNHLDTSSHTALLRPRLRGLTSYSASPDHHAQFYVNGTFIGDAYWDGMDAFTGEFTFPQNLLITGTNVISYHIPLDLAGVTEDRGLTNWFEIEFFDVYQADDDRIWFTLDTAGTWKPTITGFTDDTLFLLDISDVQHPVLLTNAQVTSSGSHYALTFEDASDGTRRYFAAAAPAFLSPANMVLDTPSHLHDTANSADWIAITHHAFMDQAQELAAHRASFSGLRTMVVDVQDVYDEFSGGLLDPEAIRRFLAYAHEHWTPPTPRYVVLIGDGHYDYKDYLVHPNQQFIPPYVDLVDCFLGETAADNRYVAGERTNANPDAMECQKHAMPFMAIGRLPVNSTEEAEGMVKRIICYENPSDARCADTPPIDGANLRAIFVSDKNDNAGAFTCHSDEVAGQQRCSGYNFGYRGGSPRRPAAASAESFFTPQSSPLAVVSPQAPDRRGFIGGMIWEDADGDAWMDAGETGIDGVVVNLWEDADHSGTLSSGDVKVATVTSGDNPNTTETEHGWYGFDGLDKTNYLVEIDPTNFEAGGALEGMNRTAGDNPWFIHMDGQIPDEYERIKLYLQDEYAPGNVPYPSGNSVKDALVAAINGGAAFVTYNGHSTTWKWSGSDVFDVYTLPNLHNAGAWPVFLPMTCLEGQFHDITQSALSESVVRSLDDEGKPTGAVASWGPTGLGVATGHMILYNGFFDAVFHKGILTIGDAILYAKALLYNSDSLFKDLIETYTLFGDPAMRLNVPLSDLSVTETVTPAGNVEPGDTLTYTITVHNGGPVTAYDVTITDTLPSSLNPVSWTSVGLPLSLEPGTTYVWHAPELAAGQTVTLTVVARVDPNTQPGTPVVNRVVADSGSADANSTNNTASVVNDVGSTYGIEGLVFVDTNANQTHDSGEAGLPNVDVTLSNADGPISTVHTGSDGRYAFSSVPPGVYTVTVTQPTGYVPTTPRQRQVEVVDASVFDVDFGFISATNVRLVAFNVVPRGSDMLITWTVREEQGVAGYRVYRSVSAEGDLTPVTEDLIPAQGIPYASYQVVDTPPAAGEWYYWLEAVGYTGQNSWFGPVSATVQMSAVRRVFIPFVASR